MAVIPIGGGKGIEWKPTDELMCAKCQEPFDPATSLTTVCLVTDQRREGIGLEIRIGRYWYLHNTCRAIEKRLQEMGANISWHKLDIPFILGFSIGKNGFRIAYANYEKRHQWFKPGVYERLVEQWRPALRGLDTHVTETVNIDSISLSDETAAPANILPAYTVSLEGRAGWLARRFETLKRDKYRCRLCGASTADGDDVRLEVDHRIARANGGTDAPDNLWTLCFACNRGKGVQDL